MSRAATGMGTVTALARVLGFVRILVVAAVLGTTYLGNAFGAANSVSNVLFELLAAGALSAVLVPTFVGLLDADDQDGAERVAGGVLGAALAGLGAVAVLGIALAPLLARLLTAGVPTAVAADQRVLVTELLRFFVPQVLLYAAGTVAIAALHARRRFVAAAAAPIGNTVVTVAALVAFRAVAGPEPGLDLGVGERVLLIVAGTGGVLAFVGVLLVACRASGFALRPRWPGRDPRVAAVLRHSGWGVVLHTGAGLLLGAAVVAGSAVEGGVVAYQVAWVFFLAPYGILAQPIHTTILPELVAEATDPTRFTASLRWSVERMALLVLPVSGALVVLAGPGMRAVSFGATSGSGPELLAAALAGLAVGLFPYGAFLLLARACYARGDSRTPGGVSLVAALAGTAVLGGAALLADGTARGGVLGLGHSVAYGLGAVVLARHLHGSVGSTVWTPVLGRVAVVAAVVAGLGWAWPRLVEVGAGRGPDLLVVAVTTLAGTGLVALGYRLAGVGPALTARHGPPGAEETGGPAVTGALR
ncbi:MAG: murein biosynthesis integral membrane protein MurJ [Acidimicrobiia bacterium]